MKKNKPYQVYFLKDKREPNKVKYVGVTSASLNERLKGHFWQPKERDIIKYNWLHENKEFIIIELVITTDKETALTIEYCLIELHRLLNLGCLNNKPHRLTVENIRHKQRLNIHH